MNLGVYFPIIDKVVLQHVVNEIKRGFDSGLLRDASIFYDDVGPMEIHNVCGMFHATDIWRFEGDLVTFHPSSIRKAEAAGNKFTITYCHGLTRTPTLELLMSLRDYPCLALSDDDAKEFTRVTGKSATGTCPGFKGLTKLVGGIHHE